ncbi:MAG TPA: GNAT family N-acetyltransferase [Sphingobium sp.]|uniref:GNAT family N-acetyltransferase n=1 Tax=Sphingobium sp. TaxID=1912891 RepID=UPI002ED2BC19
MIQDLVSAPNEGGYRQLAFPQRVQDLCASGQVTGMTRAASVEEVLKLVGIARQTMPGLADDSVVLKILAHNPELVQLAGRADTDTPAFLAYLPLNAAGLRAIVRGELNSSDPDVELICTKGEAPAAIYIWLVFAPRKFVSILRALDLYLGRLAPRGCPLFAQAANAASAALFSRMGFRAVMDSHAEAPEKLLVLASLDGSLAMSASQAKPEKPKLDVRVARTMDDLLKSFSVRSATYVAEQLCPFDEEFDGNDFCATHLIGEIDGEPAGSIRVRFFSDFVKIERLAVRREYRQSRLAFRLVRAALAHASRKGYRRAYGHSRTDLTRFWGIFGFKPLEGRSPFMFSDVEYVELQADLVAAIDSIAIGVDPYVIIRPEGAWDTPGPLDRSALRSTVRSAA